MTKKMISVALFGVFFAVGGCGGKSKPEQAAISADTAVTVALDTAVTADTSVTVAFDMAITADTAVIVALDTAITVVTVALDTAAAVNTAVTTTPVLKDDLIWLKRMYSPDEILRSLRFVLSDKFKDFFVEKGTSVSNADWNSLYWRIGDALYLGPRINAIVVEKPAALDSLLFVVQNMKESKAIIKQIKDWCRVSTVLAAGYHYGGYADTYLETLFEVPEIQSVVKSFIGDVPGRGWYSLSTSELWHVDDEVCNYVSALSDEKQLSFYKSLFERTTYMEKAE